ncbi:MAG: hypothetical protein WC683_04015 [bacterium]
MSRITTFAKLIAAAESKKEVLLEARPSELLTNWAGSSPTYTITVGAYEVEALTVDGVSYTRVYSVAALGAEKYCWLGGVLTVQVASGSIFTKTVVATYFLTFSRRGSTFNDRHYLPMLLSVPSVQQSQTDSHWGVSVISGGSLSLQNADGFFDELTNRFVWENKAVKLLVGGEDLPYSEYSTLFSGVIEKKHLGEQLFDLSFRDEKENWEDAALPESGGTFEKSAWANLADDDAGRQIPLVFGTVRELPVVCVTRAKGTATSIHSFKYAYTGLNAVSELSTVRVNGVAVPYLSGSVSAATFKLSGTHYAPGDSVSVDCIGYKSGTVVIENPVDVFTKLATLCGRTYTPDSAAFATAKTRAADFAIGLAVIDAPSFLDVCGELMKSCLGNIFINNAGQVSINVWDPELEATLPTISDVEIADGSLEADTALDDVRKVVRVGWRRKWVDGDSAHVQVSSSEVERLYGIRKSITVETLLSTETGAHLLRDRLALIYSMAMTEVGFRTKLQLADLDIGERLRITWRRTPSSDALSWLNSRRIEISSIEKDFDGSVIAIRANDLRGIGELIGHWTSDTPTFPTDLGGGSGATWSSSWTAAQKAYAKANWGYWTDDGGFADPADPDSRYLSYWW